MESCVKTVTFVTFLEKRNNFGYRAIASRGQLSLAMQSRDSNKKY